MASRSFTGALRLSRSHQLTLPIIQNRTFVSAIAGTKTQATKLSACRPLQQTRGVKTIDFAGHKEQVFGMLCWLNPKMYNDSNIIM